MEYNIIKKEIILKRKLNKLDKFVLDFIRVLEKYIDYVIISGYVSILLGRTRATEDVDLFIKPTSMEKFFEFYEEAKRQGFECINAEKIDEIFSYLKEGLAVRFSRKNQPVPNFEIKFPKKEIDEQTFSDFITVILPEGKLKISSLERQIAFKQEYLKSDRDLEDASHIEELFKDKLDYNKINKFKEIIKNIK